MYATLNRNDIDILKLAVDKMKSVDFDAARKMELMLEAYEKQESDEKEIERYQEAIEGLPGWSGGRHDAHVEFTAGMLGRALENVQKWRDSKDDEPLDEAAERLVKRVGHLESKLAEIIDTVDAGGPDALTEVRNLAVGES